MVIRLPGEKDVQALAALVSEWGYPSGPAEVRDRLQAVQSSGTDLILVAEEDGVVAGWIHAAEHRTLARPAACEIHGLVVGRAHRMSGVGRALVDAAVVWAGNHNLSRLLVRSNVARAESHPFYTALGFRQAKTQHVYEREIPL